MLPKIYELIAKYPKLTDIHISANDYIYIRILWNLQKVSDNKLTVDQMLELRNQILDLSLHKSENAPDIYISNQDHQTSSDKIFWNFPAEIDTSRTYENYSFRVNIYSKSGDLSMAIRKLNENTIDIYDIMTKQLADNIVKKLLQASGWLILVTWPTWSGKSTTIAAMINWINNNLSQHIITLEDPIEYIFTNNKSLISQRQIGKDTKDFSTWLRSILRQNPDTILIWEIRDAETALAAINMAESWHLVFATLHTRNASQTVSRLASFAPSTQKDELQLRLSMSLLGVLCQQLVSDGDNMTAVYEYMYNNSAISNIIKKWEFYQIPNSIMTGKVDGMISMDDYQKSL